MAYGLKEARVRMGYTQEALAKASGVCRAIISGLESGRRKGTTTGTLRRLAEALGVEVSQIFLG